MKEAICNDRGRDKIIGLITSDRDGDQARIQSEDEESSLKIEIDSESERMGVINVDET